MLRFGCPSHQVLSAGSRPLSLLCLIFFFLFILIFLNALCSGISAKRALMKTDFTVHALHLSLYLICIRLDHDYHDYD